MGIQYQQTDTFASCGPAQHCSPAGLPSDLPIFTSECPAAPAAPGTTNRNVNNGTKFEVSAVFFQIEPDWDNINATAGDWTIRLHVPEVPETNLKWVATHFCHVTKTGCTNQGSLGSASKNENVVYGVNVHAVSGVSVPASPTSDDAIFVILTFKKTGGFTLTYRASQLIDSPFTELGGWVLDYERRIRGLGRGVGRGIV